MRRIAFVVTLALTLLLAACGGGALDVKPAGTHTPTAEDTATPAPSPTTTPRATPTATNTPQRGTTPVTLADVAPFGRSYVRATWNYLSGAGTARALYDLFTPDCQRMVSLTSLERTPSVVQSVYKGLQGKNIEDVEFAIPLNLRATSASLEIKLPLASQTRFRIEGNWLTQYEWLRQLNSAAAVDQSDTLAVSPAGDSFQIASCQHLKQWDQAR